MPARPPAADSDGDGFGMEKGGNYGESWKISVVLKAEGVLKFRGGGVYEACVGRDTVGIGENKLGKRN